MQNNNTTVATTKVAPIKNTRRGRPSRSDLEARKLAPLAASIAKAIGPSKKPERRKRIQFFIKFDDTNGYEAVAPLMLALKRAGRGVQTTFLRNAIVNAVKEAKKS